MRSPSLKATSPYMLPSFARDSLFTFLIFILPLFVLALVALYREVTHTTGTNTSTTGIANMANHNALNVFKKPLAIFSKEPLTGFYRDGYCRVGAEDGGNHAVAGTIHLLSSYLPIQYINFHWLMYGMWYVGVLTKEFLDFSASRGNNLRSIGLEPGCKWCLCTARWKEAVDAAKGPDDPVVPKSVVFPPPPPPLLLPPTFIHLLSSECDY